MVGASLALCAPAAAQSARTAADASVEAQAIVQQLRDLPIGVPASGPSNGVTPPAELRRAVLYRRLSSLGDWAVVALASALQDPDVHMRKNAATALNALGGGWFERGLPKLKLAPRLPALISALRDPDADVRAWTAQAIGSIGADAASAVPALIVLLDNAEEGSRNSACIALRGIGPAAEAALPALRARLADAQPNVRRFAADAIAAISRSSDSGGIALPCTYRENAFRENVKPPRNVHRVEPDLTGLPPLAAEQIVIVEVRIDATGRVTEHCLLRGVRADVDQRVLEAVRAWRFNPPRLLFDANMRGGDRLTAGTAIPIIMTVTVVVGRR